MHCVSPDPHSRRAKHDLSGPQTSVASSSTSPSSSYDSTLFPLQLSLHGGSMVSGPGSDTSSEGYQFGTQETSPLVGSMQAHHSLVHHAGLSVTASQDGGRYSAKTPFSGPVPLHFSSVDNGYAANGFEAIHPQLMQDTSYSSDALGLHTVSTEEAGTMRIAANPGFVMAVHEVAPYNRTPATPEGYYRPSLGYHGFTHEGGTSYSATMAMNPPNAQGGGPENFLFGTSLRHALSER
ncbi:hypothetical protein ACQY0O_001629 [Thecaphora frezii]